MAALSTVLLSASSAFVPSLAPPHPRSSLHRSAVRMIAPVCDDTYEELIVGHSIASSEPVVVDFAADYCGPCKLVEPALTRLDAKPGMRVLKANLGNPEKSKRLRTWLLSHNVKITALPTLVLFRDGAPVRTMFGADQILKESTLHSFAFDAPAATESPEVVGSVKPSRTPKPVRRDESNDSLVKQLTQRLGFAFP
jgi:thioredoxin 1